MDFAITGKQIKGTSNMQGQANTPKPTPKKVPTNKATQPVTKPKQSIPSSKIQSIKTSKPQVQKQAKKVEKK